MAMSPSDKERLADYIDSLHAKVVNQYKNLEAAIDESHGSEAIAREATYYIALKREMVIRATKTISDLIP